MKLVIFDVDGTLSDSNHEGSKCFGQAFQDIFGQPIPSMNWSAYPSVSDTVIFHAAYEQCFSELPTPSAVQRFEERYNNLLQAKIEHYPTMFRAVKGAKKLTDYLLNHPDYIVGIATGGWKASAIIKMNHIKIAHTKMYAAYADGHFERANILKESIVKAEAVYGDFEKIIYIGDAKWDVITTKKLNLPLIGIRLKGDIEFLQNLGVQDVIIDFQDIPQFLQLLDAATVPN